MRVLPQDVKIDEKALDYASTFFPTQECLRQYMAVLLSYPLPGELLDEVTQSTMSRWKMLMPSSAITSRPFFFGQTRRSTFCT